MGLRPDPGHQAVTQNAAAHVAGDHKTEAAEHALFIGQGATDGQQTFADPLRQISIKRHQNTARSALTVSPINAREDRANSTKRSSILLINACNRECTTRIPT